MFVKTEQLQQELILRPNNQPIIPQPSKPSKPFSEARHPERWCEKDHLDGKWRYLPGHATGHECFPKILHPIWKARCNPIWGLWQRIAFRKCLFSDDNMAIHGRAVNSSQVGPAIKIVKITILLGAIYHLKWGWVLGNQTLGWTQQSSLYL